LHGIDGRRLASTTLRVIVAGAAGAGATWLVADAIGTASTGAAIAATVIGLLVGAAVYVGVLAVLRVEELRVLLSIVARRNGVPRSSA
jgi:putative peptidoglycan lipid II flippase